MTYIDDLQEIQKEMEPYLIGDPQVENGYSQREPFIIKTFFFHSDTTAKEFYEKYNSTLYMCYRGGNILAVYVGYTLKASDIDLDAYQRLYGWMQRNRPDTLTLDSLWCRSMRVQYSIVVSPGFDPSRLVKALEEMG